MFLDTPGSAIVRSPESREPEKDNAHPVRAGSAAGDERGTDGVLVCDDGVEVTKTSEDGGRDVEVWTGGSGEWGESRE